MDLNLSHFFFIATYFFKKSICSFFFWPLCVACGILVPNAGISALEAQSFNHWTTSEVPEISLFKHKRQELALDSQVWG